MYLDQYRRPLPGGAASGFGAIHQGILAYLADGQHVILNTSLKHGRPVISPLNEFSGMPFTLVRPLPSTWEDSIRIQQNAWNLVKAGAPWTIFNNGQDFVTFPTTGNRVLSRGK